MHLLLRSLFCLLMAALPAAAAAQSEAQQKEINKIKLDPNYIFAESTMGSSDEARETVCLILTNFMNEYLEESGVARRVAAAELGAIKYINGKRGSSSYVFGYIPVAAFAAGAAPAAPADDPEPAPAPDPEPAPAPAPAPQPEPSPAPAPAPAPVPDSSDSSDSSDRSVRPAGGSAADELIAEMLEAKAANKAVYLLNVYKSVGKVRGFGDLASCRDAAAAYWLIAAPDGSIEALLGPSASDDRHDYVSGATRHLADFGGRYAVWFTPRAR